MTDTGLLGYAALAALVEQHEARQGREGLFEFALGVAVVGALFWVLYHLEKDWPERLFRDPGFRDDALAIGFALALAWWLVPFIV